MKTHLLIGYRMACCDFMPRDALFTANTRLVDCKLCRKTRVFVRVAARQAERQRRAREKTEQMELFGGGM